MNKKNILIITGIILISFISAEASYCCERTNEGAWCQNAPKDQCNSEYRKAPTSCEATSYCRSGCCFNSKEGTCIQNTPQKNCEDLGGLWKEDTECKISQCELGCCLIGDNGAFVTQTRCKRLSFLYGLNISFRTDITSEIECLASTRTSIKGACVFEKEFERTCISLTRGECTEQGGTKFHEGYLCSAESLSTNCAMTEKTTCVDGKDEVYFVDSCGNIANVYDASKINDINYWTKIRERSESCNSDESNAGSSSCGNCNYFLGSTCKKYERNTDRVRPVKGENICRDLSCEYNGGRYKHGETWCAKTPGVLSSLPGSRHLRYVCYNGEVTIEECAEYRQEICLESSIESRKGEKFSTASCIANKWQECTAQQQKKRLRKQR